MRSLDDPTRPAGRTRTRRPSRLPHPERAQDLLRSRLGELTPTAPAPIDAAVLPSTTLRKSVLARLIAVVGEDAVRTSCDPVPHDDLEPAETRSSVGFHRTRSRDRVRDEGHAARRGPPDDLCRLVRCEHHEDVQHRRK